MKQFKFNLETQTECAQCLQIGCKQLGLALSDSYIEQMVNYLNELSRWNKIYNLTAVTHPVTMVWRHIIDSLTCLPYLQGERIADMATGAGLPGIPLAAYWPEKSFTLIEANGKKIRFLRQASLALGLNNVQVVNARVEKYRPDKGFHTITARAFATIPVMITLSQHLLQAEGQFIFMKGKRPEEELAALPGGWQAEVHNLDLDIPDNLLGMNDYEKVARHIVVVTRCK